MPVMLKKEIGLDSQYLMKVILQLLAQSGILTTVSFLALLISFREREKIG
jgi:hypothetical protein